MLSIYKSKRGKKESYFVSAPTSNGRILHHSETLSAKLNAFKNITASLKMFGGKSVLVADYTLEEPKVIKVFATGKKVDVPNKKLPKLRTQSAKKANQRTVKRGRKKA
jgi:hypothetical protein